MQMYEIYDIDANKLEDFNIFTNKTRMIYQKHRFFNIQQNAYALEG